MRAALQLPERMSSDPGLDGPPFAEGFQPLQIKHQMKGTNTLCGASDGQVAAWQHDMYGASSRYPPRHCLLRFQPVKFRAGTPTQRMGFMVGQVIAGLQERTDCIVAICSPSIVSVGHLTSNGFELECQAGFQMVVE